MSKKNKKNTVIPAVMLLLLTVVLMATWLYEQQLTASNVVQTVDTTSIHDDSVVQTLQLSKLETPVLIDPRSEQVIEHLGYTVSYNALWHIPNWVAYELTSEEIEGLEERSNHFKPDPFVQGDPVVTSDYTRSGYDRGHMAPAADMKWSKQAMEESFYMTNICPQNHSNNAGDWKDLEEFVRDLAHRYSHIYIACGPVVTDTNQTIGTERKIVIPSAFYKNLLRQKEDGTWTAIAFVMPNMAGNRPLMTYMKTIDEVEQLTGIDFFYNLPDSIEVSIESDYTIADWTL